MEETECPNTLRTNIVRVRLSGQEVALLDKARDGCPRATYLRQLMLSEDHALTRRQVSVRCASMDALVRELNRIGVNVNQLVKFARGLPVEAGAELSAETLKDGMRSVAASIDRFSNCNECVLHNEYAQLGLGDRV